MSRFKNRVIQVVKSVPEGTVASYGQVAAYVGVPRGARQVGWILNKLEKKHEVPWWRVINNAGRLTIKNGVYTPEDQRQHLLSEGIEVSEDYELDIKMYRFRPGEKFIRGLKLDDEYLAYLSEKLLYSS